MTRRIIYLMLILLGGAFTVSAQADRDKILRLEQRLVEANSAGDSIPILYDLYDLAPAADLKHYASMLYGTATRAGDNPTRLEALRYLLNSTSDPLEIFEYTRIAEYMPPSDDQWETAVFGRLKKYAATVPSLTESNRQDMLRDAIRTYDQGEFYDERAEIEQLYKLCIFLNASTKGKLYLNYMTRLKTLLEEQPKSKSNALKNMFYIQLGIQALNNEDFTVCNQSVESALKLVNDLEKLRYQQGRKFARFRMSKYTLLRRRLACFPVLSPEELESTYNQLKALADQDPSLRDDFNSQSSRVKIYYNMATHNYKEAIPYLVEYLKSAKPQFKRTMLSYLTEAAEAVGDTQTMIKAMKEYNAMLHDYIISDGEERYCEMQIIYDTHHLKAETARADKEMKDNEARMNTIMLIVVVVAVAILIVFLLLIIRLYRRLRRQQLRAEKTIDDNP